MIAITFGIRFNLQIVIKQKLVVESRFVKYFGILHLPLYTFILCE
jgi:hypothetical protein